MPLYTFNNNIPAANNNPSVDQPEMLNNNISTLALINEDHYSFNDASGGLHKQLRLPVLVAAPAVGVRQVGEGTLYTKTITGESQLFYIPDNVAVTNEYQLTRAIDAQFATFGTNTVYDGAKPLQKGGWTFLPGNIIMFYGTVSNISDGDPVTYPFPFPTTQYSLTISRRNSSGSTTAYGFSAFSNAGFTYSTSSGSAGIFFTATGV